MTTEEKTKFWTTSYGVDLPKSTIEVGENLISQDFLPVERQMGLNDFFETYEYENSNSDDEYSPPIQVLIMAEWNEPSKFAVENNYSIVGIIIGLPKNIHISSLIKEDLKDILSKQIPLNTKVNWIMSYTPIYLGD